MIPGIVGQHIGRSNRHLFLTGLALLGLLALILLIPLSLHVFSNFFQGPFLTDPQAIPHLGNPNTLEKYYVKVNLNPTSFHHQLLHVTGGEQHENAYYHFYKMDPFVLTVKTSSSATPEFAIGTLKPLPDNLWNRASAEVQKIPGKHELAGTMLDASYSFFAQTLLLMAILALLAAGAVSLLVWAVVRAKQPYRHALAKELARFGPPDEIALAVDAEFRAGAQVTGPVQTTQSWLLRKRFFSPTLLYLGDVIWAYKLETKRTVNGLPAGSIYSAIISTRQRQRLALKLKSAQVDQLILNIRSSAPHALIGFNHDWQTTWRHNPTALIALVDQLAADAQGQPPAPPPPPA